MNEIYGNFSQPGRTHFSRVIWSGATWCRLQHRHWALSISLFAYLLGYLCVLLVVKRRGQRRKERLIRLCRLSSSPAAVVDTVDTAAWSSRRWRSSSTDSPRPLGPSDAANCSMQAEFNPNYTSLELSLGLAAVEHELNEIPDDCLVIIRSVFDTLSCK